MPLAQLLSFNVTWQLVASDSAKRSAADSSQKTPHFVDATQLLADRSQLFCDTGLNSLYVALGQSDPIEGLQGILHKYCSKRLSVHNFVPLSKLSRFGASDLQEATLPKMDISHSLRLK